MMFFRKVWLYFRPPLSPFLLAETQLPERGDVPLHVWVLPQLAHCRLSWSLLVFLSVKSANLSPKAFVFDVPVAQNTLPGSC